jgi:hypothetical protein
MEKLKFNGVFLNFDKSFQNLGHPALLKHQPRVSGAGVFLKKPGN